MTREEYKGLCQKARYYMEKYYNEDMPEISDYEYDMLMQQIKETENAHPDWVTADSPTQFVAKKKTKRGLREVRHITPMLSIQDVFSEEEVRDWVRKVKEVHPDATFSVEQKIDGLSMTLRYQNGRLVLAETRGDGFTGEDVTLNAGEIADIPSDIMEKKDLELRGEVYMTKEQFEKANEKQEMKGQKTFANPRNCAAGALRQLDADVTKERKLNFFVFNIQSGESAYMQSQKAGLDKVNTMGFKTIPYQICSGTDEVLTAIRAIGEIREQLPYGIDGAVIKINQKAFQRDFAVGTENKYSAGHIAFKYPSEEKEAVIAAIELTVGRTGRIAPTAVFLGSDGCPLQLCGTNVSRATLHNQDYIDSLGVDIGAKVLVYKSGDIIPKIKKVTKGTGNTYILQEKCPICGAKLTREPGAADIICPNEECDAKSINKIIHFASKGCMNIKGLGENSVEALYDAGYLESFLDIYMLADYKEDLIRCGILGKKKGTENILAAVEESKHRTADKLLAGLGIPLIGRTAARELMKHFKSVDELIFAKKEILLEIPGIGEEMADSIISYFSKEKNRQAIKKLEEFGVNMEGDSQKTESGKLYGKSFCITGTLPSMGRSEIEALITGNGGKVTGSVSKKTGYLIAGENAGSKLDKATQLGVPVIRESDFLHMI